MSPRYKVEGIKKALHSEEAEQCLYINFILDHGIGTLKENRCTVSPRDRLVMYNKIISTLEERRSATIVFRQSRI